MNFKTITIQAIVSAALLLSACSEDIEELQNNIENELLDDPDFKHLIEFPESTNSACPDWQPGQTITLTESITLPENCAYERVSLVIESPNITLDCNNAAFNGLNTLRRKRYGEVYPEGEAPIRYGLVIQGKINQPRVEDVTVQRCQFLNYGDAMTVRFPLPKDILLELRAGTRTEASIQALSPTNINILNSKLINSHLHGIFVNRYITKLNIRHSQLSGSGNSSIYLGADVANSEITNNTIEGNGFSSYDLAERKRSGRRSEVSQREGIAVDSASDNYIANNTFSKNADGGVYLYKNCWEHNEDPFTAPHRYGSNNNVIDNNRFIREVTGVWVAERADRDLAGFTCGDELIYSRDDEKFYRDIAQNNRITNNRFENNDNGIRVQDDGTIISGNTFINTQVGPDIKVFSFVREIIGDPVDNTTIQGNTLSEPDNISFEHGAS